MRSPDACVTSILIPNNKPQAHTMIHTYILCARLQSGPVCACVRSVVRFSGEPFRPCALRVQCRLVYTPVYVCISSRISLAHHRASSTWCTSWERAWARDAHKHARTHVALMGLWPQISPARRTIITTNTTHPREEFTLVVAAVDSSSMPSNGFYYHHHHWRKHHQRGHQRRMMRSHVEPIENTQTLQSVLSVVDIGIHASLPHQTCIRHELMYQSQYNIAHLPFVNTRC